MRTKELNLIRDLRARRTRRRIGAGTAERPRLSVFRSNAATSAQLIDDTKGETLVSVSSFEIKKKGTKKEKAAAVGEALAKKAIELGIKRVVFDRGSYRFHGRVKELAEAARRGGLQF